MAEAAEAVETADSRTGPLVVARDVAVPLVVLALDQLTKAWVRAELTMGDPVPVLGDNVRLLYIENEGAAFGLSVGPHSSMIFLVLAAIASAIVLFLYLRTPAGHGLERLALGLILGGAVGNIVDRIRWERVVDFIQVGVAEHYWPIFNVADSAVTVGAITLAYTYLFHHDGNR
ncbi:MAG: signal peptidase II [Gemmatimonadota bacterium]|nr:signal peptidase II [Gemmatimonadota bacterium]